MKLKIKYKYNSGEVLMSEHRWTRKHRKGMESEWRRRLG